MKNFISRLFYREREIILCVITLLVVLVAAKFGQYLFFGWKTSPAVIWPAMGIGTAIVWIYGYRYAAPVFGALFIASITGPAAHIIPGVVTTPLAQTATMMFVVYLLRRMQFDTTFSSVRGMVIFFVVVVAGNMLAPSVTTLISYLTGNLTTAAYLSWSRAWGGYVFSTLVLFPFIVSWTQARGACISSKKREIALVAALVVGSVYLLFWTRVPSEISFLIFAVFFSSHLWASRFSFRVLTTFTTITTVFGMLGLFLSPRPDRELGSQLFAGELFLVLVIPIFYAFSAVVRERVHAFRELRETINKIEQENINKNEFIAVLAHELRNPLSPVKTTLEILDLQSTDQEMKQLIKSAIQQVHTMRRLLDDLLDTTRMSQGKFQLQIAHVNLCDMIQHSIQSVKELMEERRHTLLTDPTCDDSIWLDVDPVRFEQVVVNILNNAAKYTDPGGQIRITHSVVGNNMVLSVTDNGHGIDKEHLQHVFESFWQVKNSRSRTASGIGVGLSLTKRIVEVHGGTLTVASEGLGKGSTFTVTLPISKLRTAIPSVIPDVRTVPCFKILVADDNTVAADALAKLLRLKGHAVTAVYSGKEVLEIVDTFTPEVILLDIGLPDMTGYEVAQKLRAGGFTEKVIAVTGYGQQEDKDRAFEAGFDHHFIKPVALARLEEYLLTIR